MKTILINIDPSYPPGAIIRFKPIRKPLLINRFQKNAKYHIGTVLAGGEKALHFITVSSIIIIRVLYLRCGCANWRTKNG